MADWKPSRYRVLALTTRPFQLADDEHMTRVAPEALEGMLAQVRSKFLPRHYRTPHLSPTHRQVGRRRKFSRPMTENRSWS